ncbi:hypothetical protein Lesp02_45740 [Lentzea sp. NBRC 105346]|uniref:hypothetical protein n=1 Tax=Lentzea sp. NBRC 105346 TaxID=3032205 RepID=UPI0024A06A81|nr:hypothetical protein [Lentzea sp. NBRC 105346]GLZ32386.1 hypothetical protein Lesp02_45740 [Lentzea sp. NBRC 105346]
MTEARDRLAAAQAELLRALLADGPIPSGFDEKRIVAERRALLAKRRGVVAMLGPEVAGDLGDRFRPLFDEYAVAHPRAAGSRMREDAAAFAQWARDRGELTPLQPQRKHWWRRTR